MADPRFFTNYGPYTIKDLAKIAKAEIGLDSDPDKLIYDVSPLETSDSKSISFLDNSKYNNVFKKSRAGACVVSPKMSHIAPAGMSLLLSSNPYRSYALIAKTFYPENTKFVTNIHNSAYIDKSVKIGTGCSVGANSVIKRDVILQDNVFIGDGSVISNSVTVGKSTNVASNVTLSHCDIGSNCVIHPGVRIGQRGFGFDMSPEGHLDVPQLGRVIIEDYVEIGANTTIDRGSISDTEIHDGVRLDNLIHIAHNVKIGEDTAIAAKTGIAGTTVIGKRCMIGGAVGIVDHLKIVDDVVINATSTVNKDITKPGVYTGFVPLMLHSKWKKVGMWLTKLDKIAAFMKIKLKNIR